jgi:hypothetical protein
MKKKTIIVLVVAVVAVGIAAFFGWRYYAEQQRIAALKQDLQNIQNLPPAEPLKSTTDETWMKGVTVTVEGDQKLITNTVEGYSIEIPASLVMFHSSGPDFLEFFDPKTMCSLPSCLPDVAVITSQSDSSLDTYVQNEEKMSGDLQQKKLLTNPDGVSYYSYFVQGGPPAPSSGYIYYAKENNNIVQIVASEQYSDLMQNFKFLPQ